MKPEPDPVVRDWLDVQAAETLYLSSVTIAELMFGIGVLPKGKRREARRGTHRRAGAVRRPNSGFRYRCSTDAARAYADLAVAARAAGWVLPVPDGYIAAIAASHDFAVASRDASAFRAVSLAVIDPWAAAI